MAMLSVRVLHPGEYDLWDRFVSTSAQGTLFHSSKWLRASGGDFRVYACFKGSELFGGLPVVRKSALLFTTATRPMLTPYLGVVQRSSSAKYVSRLCAEKEVTRLLAHAVKADFDSIFINFVPTTVDIQPFIWEGFSPGVRYTYLLRLDDLDAIWNSMDHDRRNNITSARNDGLEVERRDDFADLMRFVNTTFERQRMLVPFREVARSYVETLRQSNQCQTFFVRNRDGQRVAAVHIVWDTKRSYYLLGGCDHRQGCGGAVVLALWDAITFTKKELGLPEFDFEGSMVPAIEKFFRLFGGTFTPYFSVQYVKPSVKVLQFLAGSKKLLVRGVRSGSAGLCACLPGWMRGAAGVAAVKLAYEVEAAARRS